MNHIHEKMQTILSAYQTGMSKKNIDPVGDGSAVKTLLNGGRPSDAKIEYMYANVQACQQQLAKLNEWRLTFDPQTVTTRVQKEQILLAAVAGGVAKIKLDPKCDGAAVNRLSQGKRVNCKKLDEMYNNLLRHLGYSSTGDNARDVSDNQMKTKIRSLEISLASAHEQISRLNAMVASLQQQCQSVTTENSPSKRGRKILGVTVVQKTDKVRGKSYKRWYGLRTVNGKRQWIYIGTTLANAQTKIAAALSANKEGK